MAEHGLQHITVRNDTPLDTWWVNEFVETGLAWEEFARRIDGEIEGLVTPYGIHVKLTDRSERRVPITYSATRQLENVRGSDHSLRPSVYSYVLTVEATLTWKNRNTRLLCYRSNWFNKLRSYLLPLRNKQHHRGFLIMASSPDVLKSIKNSHILETIEKTGKIELKRHEFTIRAYSIPTYPSTLTQYYEAIHSLIKALP